MTAMCASIDKLTDEGSVQVWFSPAVHDHHKNEEDIFFPWVATKATLPEKFYEGHEELISQMDVLCALCETIIGKQGKDCASELSEHKVKMHSFTEFMRGKNQTR
jgi:hypothetical protein